MLTNKDADLLIQSFYQRHVVVVGDVMLDEYARGDASRVSPEAPVPVVDLKERILSPGGAANAAANVVSLGGRATVLGIVGEDAAAEGLRVAFTSKGITHALTTDPGRPTTHKLRVVARTQQIVRVDVESRQPVSELARRAIIASIESMVDGADALVVSDYAKGVVSDEVARACVASAQRRGIPVVADPKGRHFAKYAGATIVTPNVAELEVATGATTNNEDDAVVAAARELLGMLAGTAVLVTRGSAGMTLLERDRPPVHLPTVARSVFDVTGAGDTVVGALALALAARVPLAQCLVLASHAASVAVSKPGTVAVTREELLDSFAR